MPYPSPCPSPILSTAHQLLSAIDTDGNGVLDLNEVFASLVDWSDLHKDENWPAWCRKMFEKLDVDSSGAIDLEELTKVLPKSMEGQRTVNALRMLHGERVALHHTRQAARPPKPQGVQVRPIAAP